MINEFRLHRDGGEGGGRGDRGEEKKYGHKV